MRRKIIQACCVMVLLNGVVQASELRVEGGQLVLEGRLIAERLTVEPGAWLRGNGTLEGDLVAGGHVSPGGVAPDNVGTQRVTGAATFEVGSKFYVFASSHSALDRLEAGGPVAGSCELVVTNAPGAVPVNEIVIRGNAASVFAGFAPADLWVWRTATTGTVDLILTNLRGDSDANGLPDWWELTYFNVRTGTDPKGDFDNDHFNNESEYAANTLPKDDTSLLQMTRIANQNGAALAWDTAVGRKYTLLAGDNPLGPWTTSAVLTVYSQPAQSWTSSVAAAQQVYGVRVEENGP